jgi:ATP-dependent exoDNAse (exonuclease V) alpha subunit
MGAGVPSCTAAQFLLYEAGQLTSKDIVVVDEAAMLDTRRLDALLTRVADSGAKAVLVGDHHQLPAVETGGAFAALVERLDAVELQQNRRQRHAWERDALSRLRIAAGGPGGSAAVVASYRHHDRLHEVESTSEARQAMVRDWHAARQSGQRVAMVATRREDVEELNRLARAALVAEGAVDSDSATIGGRQFAIGDQVVCLRNDRRVGVHNGLFGEVVHVDRTNSTLTLDADGEAILLPATYLHAGRLGHAYATTIHKAQGLTVDRTLLLGSDDLYRQAAYVGLSRGRDRNDLYVAVDRDSDVELHGTHDTDEPVDRLVRSFGRDGSKRLADVQMEAANDERSAPPTAALWRELGELTALEVGQALGESDRERRTDLVAELECRTRVEAHAATPTSLEGRDLDLE